MIATEYNVLTIHKIHIDILLINYYIVMCGICCKISVRQANLENFPVSVLLMFVMLIIESVFNVMYLLVDNWASRTEIYNTVTDSSEFG